MDSVPGLFGITMDGWSSRVMRGYMVVTLHWISSEWELCNAVLEFKYFPSPHNQFTTSDLLLSIMKDYNIQTRVRAITTDSGSEMAPAVELIRQQLTTDLQMDLDPESYHVRCACHIINRAVVDASEVVQDEMAKLRTLLKTIRLSAAMRAKYSDLSVVLGRSSKNMFRISMLKLVGTVYMIWDIQVTKTEIFWKLFATQMNSELSCNH